MQPQEPAAAPLFELNQGQSSRQGICLNLCYQIEPGNPCILVKFIYSNLGVSDRSRIFRLWGHLYM